MSETEITWGEVKVLEEGSYSLIDIRDDSSVAYGMIPGARQIVQSKLEESLEETSERPVADSVLYAWNFQRGSSGNAERTWLSGKKFKRRICILAGQSDGGRKRTGSGAEPGSRD